MPEFKVGHQGVFYHDGEGFALYGIGDFLHIGGVDAGARPYPQGGDACLLASFHLCGCHYLGAHTKAERSLEVSEPWKSFVAQFPVLYCRSLLIICFTYSGWRLPWWFSG